MMILQDQWTDKDTLNICLGIVFSIITAYVYEYLRSKRKEAVDKQDFSFLESPEEHLWQHYDIKDGVIVNSIDSYMHLRYLNGKRLKMTWFEFDGKPKGEGFITWQDTVHGQLSAHEYSSNSYRYRNVFYREIEHAGSLYDAIFVNADDEGTKYVMLSLTSHRSLIDL